VKVSLLAGVEALAEEPNTRFVVTTRADEPLAVHDGDVDTVRLHLFEIGGRVRELARRVHLHLATSRPAEPLWLALAAHGAGS
jgi:hypothetical protein